MTFPTITTAVSLEGYQAVTLSDGTVLAMRNQEILAEYTTSYQDCATYICRAAKYYDRVQASRRWKRWILCLLRLWENKDD